MQNERKSNELFKFYKNKSYLNRQDIISNTYNQVYPNSNNPYLNLSSIISLPEVPEDITRKSTMEKTHLDSNKSLSLHKRQKTKDEINNGRWTRDEHIKFVEAILKYENEWKLVQHSVESRSSTQARSHAQKFFLKIKKNEALNRFRIHDVCSLCQVMKDLKEEEKKKVLSILYIIPFEKGKNKVSKGREVKESNENKENDREKVKFKVPLEKKREKELLLNQKREINKEIPQKKSENHVFHNENTQKYQSSIIDSNQQQCIPNVINYNYNTYINTNYKISPSQNQNPNPSLNNYHLKASSYMNNAYQHQKDLPFIVNKDIKNIKDKENDYSSFSNKTSKPTSSNDIYDTTKIRPNQLQQAIPFQNNTVSIEYNNFFESFDRQVNFKRSDNDLENIFFNTFSAQTNYYKNEHEDSIEKYCSFPFFTS